MDLSQIRPHDLLRITELPSAHQEMLPGWVRAGLRHAPWAVVRRFPPAPPGLVALGVRGPTRDRRYALDLDVSQIEELVAPEDLLTAYRAGLHRLPGPAAATIRDLTTGGLRHHSWGPVGSAAFQLVTGVPVMHPDSDLDVLLRSHQPLVRSAAAELIRSFRGQPCRIDCQVETQAGGVSLAEWASGSQRVLLRTPQGPRLTDDPWRHEATP